MLKVDLYIHGGVYNYPLWGTYVIALWSSSLRHCTCCEIIKINSHAQVFYTHIHLLSMIDILYHLKSPHEILSIFVSSDLSLSASPSLSFLMKWMRLVVQHNNIVGMSLWGRLTCCQWYIAILGTSKIALGSWCYLSYFFFSL